MPAPARIALALASLVATAAPALSGGLEIPDNGTFALSRGGAFTVRADDPTALIYNPGGLTRLSGTHLLYNHQLMWEHATFTRAVSDLPPGTDYGTTPNAPVSNTSSLFPLGISLIATSDLGLDDWTFAFGVYGPNAHGEKRWPVQGGQRYLLTEFDALLGYASLAVAYGDDETYGVGVTLQYAVAPKIQLGLVIDGSQAGGLHAYHSGNDVEALIDLSDSFSWSALVGGWWRPIPELELALSGRVVPVQLDLEGDFSLRNIPGQTQFSDAQLEVTDSAARLDLTLPPTARLGLRYRYLEAEREVFDIELDVVYEAWSVIDRYNVELDGTINLFVGAEAPDAVINKAWKDTLSVRLGGTWSAWEGRLGEGTPAKLELSAGGYYESGATPHNYEHLDALSFDRVGLGLGVATQLGSYRLTAAYSHVFQEDRQVEERYGKVYQVRPLDPCPESCDGGAGWDGVPANAGLFESSYDMVALGIDAQF